MLVNPPKAKKPNRDKIQSSNSTAAIALKIPGNILIRTISNAKRRRLCSVNGRLAREKSIVFNKGI